jgi:hypothetical protein
MPRSPQLFLPKSFPAPLSVYLWWPLFMIHIFPNSFLDLIIQTTHGKQYVIVIFLIMQCALVSPYFLSLAIRHFIRHNLYPHQNRPKSSAIKTFVIVSVLCKEMYLRRLMFCTLEVKERKNKTVFRKSKFKSISQLIFPSSSNSTCW